MLCSGQNGCFDLVHTYTIIHHSTSSKTQQSISLHSFNQTQKGWIYIVYKFFLQTQSDNLIYVSCKTHIYIYIYIRCDWIGGNSFISVKSLECKCKVKEKYMITCSNKFKGTSLETKELHELNIQRKGDIFGESRGPHHCKVCPICEFGPQGV
jgi:hypothetical protein